MNLTHAAWILKARAHTAATRGKRVTTTVDLMIPFRSHRVQVVVETKETPTEERKEGLMLEQKELTFKQNEAQMRLPQVL